MFWKATWWPWKMFAIISPMIWVNISDLSLCDEILCCKLFLLSILQVIFHYAKIMSLIYEQKQHLKSTYDSTKTFRYFPNIFIFCVFRWEIITTYLKVVCSSFCFYLQYYGTYILKWRLPTKKDIWIKKSQLIIYEQVLGSLSVCYQIKCFCRSKYLSQMEWTL